MDGSVLVLFDNSTYNLRVLVICKSQLCRLPPPLDEITSRGSSVIPKFYASKYGKTTFIKPREPVRILQ